MIISGLEMVLLLFVSCAQAVGNRHDIMITEQNFLLNLQNYS